MVKVLEEKGYRFYIYSNDHLLIHIHIIKEDTEAKMHLEPEILIKYNFGFKSKELRNILLTIEINFDYIKQRWHEPFNE